MSQVAAAEPARNLDLQDEDHHVHFDVKSTRSDSDSDSSCVTYERAGDTIRINLGFLKIKHRYLVELLLPSALFGKALDARFEPDVQAEPNLHCSIKEFSGVKHDHHDHYEMKIEFFAYKEKLLRETLHIVNRSNSKEVLQLVIAARVLGKGKGTPMLRTGIHCIGVEDVDSDAEDDDECALKKK